MDIILTGRNFGLDESLKEYLIKKINRLGKTYEGIYRCEVILEEEKLRKNAEIILHLKRNKLVVKESSDDIYGSIDAAVHKLKTQLRKLHGKMSSKRRSVGVLDKMVSGFTDPENNVSEDEKGQIIQMNVFADKPMLPEEAKLELKLMDKSFIMFKNASTGEANVLYKRSDGNHGLIEPDF
ncbi:MAG: ribosome-associated translation inhibitor RaiA [Candidatus Omnitrophica bacterium]|nr:ribosome-associated translation inhibitor RaiA [Candidatus Omnitrophota bacterium]